MYFFLKGDPESLAFFMWPPVVANARVIGLSNSGLSY